MLMLEKHLLLVLERARKLWAPLCADDEVDSRFLLSRAACNIIFLFPFRAPTRYVVVWAITILVSRQLQLPHHLAIRTLLFSAFIFIHWKLTKILQEKY